MESLKIISDNTENRENIAFGFDAYANAIAELIATKSNKTPFTIGISGSWGSGKTTLMKQVENLLLKEIPNDGNFREIRTVWFQAWKYKDEDEILAALINDIFEVLDKEKQLLKKGKGQVIEYAKELPKSINFRKVFSMLSKAAINIDITEFIKDIKPDDPVYKNFLSFYDNFEKEFDEILWQLLGHKKDDEKKDEKAALVVFIDDLDRCPLPKIIQILETVKLFMDREGCIFVIGAAKDIIQDALKKASDYKDIDAEKFLEKIVQIEFLLPKKTHENSDIFISEITKNLGINDEVKKEDIELILPILDFNPRRIIALFNRISLQQSIMRYSENSLEFKKILFWRVLDLYRGAFFYKIREDGFFKNFKKDLNIYSNLTEKEKKDDNVLEGKLDVADNMVWVRDEKIVSLISKMELTDEEYKQLVSYSKKLQEEKPELKEGQDIREYCEEMEKIYSQGRSDFKKFVQIKGGKYNMSGLGERSIKGFQMSKYPVTNKWFKEFIDAGGYKDEKYWSDESKGWLNEKSIIGPDFWDESIFNHPGQPVVGVSWYEAVAFCNWLTKKEGKTYRLPSESEWQVAAGGKENREYAWGNEWNKSFCNNMEVGLNKTSVVGIFGNWNTPEGVSDMSGNVWEWCQDEWNNDLKGAPTDGSAWEPGVSSTRVLRGGSWDDYAHICQAANRDYGIPGKRFNTDIGFRLVFVP